MRYTLNRSEAELTTEGSNEARLQKSVLTNRTEQSEIMSTNDIDNIANKPDMRHGKPDEIAQPVDVLSQEA